MMHQEEGKGWRIGRSLPFQHCQNSLSPIGLVTMEAVYPDGSVWGHRITDYGLTTGKDFAGCVLKWSFEHPKFSLYKIVGATQSTSIKDEQTLEKKRAQETRYKIFWEIATNPSNRIRMIDIADATNEYPKVISSHLSNLHRNGVLSYEAIELRKSYSVFKRKETIPDKEPEPCKREIGLPTRLFGLLSKRFIQTPLTYTSIEEIANALIQQYPEYENLNRKNLCARISCCLTDLERQGYVDREKFSWHFRSQITVSDEQREAIVPFVTLLDNFKNEDRQNLDEGRRFGQRVLNDPNLFSELMLKAEEASPFANRTTRVEMNSWLISIIENNPNITAEQIQQVLERDYGKKLSLKGVSANLSRLGKEPNPQIVSEKTKSGNVYRVAEPHE